MTRILALAALLSTPPASLAAAETPQPPGQPNVVLFLVDDLGYGDLACHGNPHVKTPQIDVFAGQATELTQFHVSPVCAPTRASLMTGRYNFRTGVADVYGKASNMDPAEVTLAERLREASYVTGIFGKWHLGDDAQHGPNEQGFDEALVHRGPAMGQYFDPRLLHNGQPEQHTGYCLDIFTDAAIRFIRQNRSRPFFVYLPSNLIHTPLQVAPELAAEFDALGLGDSTRKIYGMIRNVDNNFGRVRAALQESGLEDNTLLIFTSDNGPCSGSQPVDRHMAGLHGLKGTVYENGIRVPCFMRWPAGFKSPTKVTRLAAHVDVLPTVLEACGVPVRADMKLDGASLWPLLRDASAKWPDRTLFFQWDSGQVPRRGHAFTVLTERWKLVQPCGMDLPNQQHIRNRYAQLCRLQGRGERSIEGPPRYELYDIAADPGETKDLAAEHPEVVEAMKKQYDTWFTDVAARWQDREEKRSP
ncbi:MAG TPA: arylsulfatase [Candidatus Anammoximicrobium sp.]|nr:arylsulfatase [Candidatus Anammoximicrobium sp.]